MKIVRAIFLIVGAAYFLSFAFNTSECGYSSERGFFTTGYDGSSRFWPLLFSVCCGLCYLGLKFGYNFYRAREAASQPAAASCGVSGQMSPTRKLIPIIFFGVLAIFAGSYGTYYVVLCLRALFAASAAAWWYFLAAEFSLLFAWRFLVWTLLSLAIYRGRVRDDQVRTKRGVIARVLFMVATGAAAFGYKVAMSLFDMPWWFTHLGHATIAGLLFCAFTYPWFRRQCATPDMRVG
jgi:hypothetical protein